MKQYGERRLTPPFRRDEFLVIFASGRRDQPFLPPIHRRAETLRAARQRLKTSKIAALILTKFIQAFKWNACA